MSIGIIMNKQCEISTAHGLHNRDKECTVPTCHNTDAKLSEKKKKQKFLKREGRHGYKGTWGDLK